MFIKSVVVILFQIFFLVLCEIDFSNNKLETLPEGEYNLWNYCIYLVQSEILHVSVYLSQIS